MATSLATAGYAVCQIPRFAKTVSPTRSQLAQSELPQGAASIVFDDPFKKHVAYLGKCSLMQRRNTSKSRLKAFVSLSAVTTGIASNQIEETSGHLINILSEDAERIPKDTETVSETLVPHLSPPNGPNAPANLSGSFSYKELADSVDTLEGHSLDINLTATDEVPGASSLVNAAEIFSSVDTPLDGVSDVSKIPTNAVQESTGLVTDSLTNFQVNSSTFIQNFPNTLQSSIESAGRAVKNAYSDVDMSIVKAVNDALFTYDKAVTDLKSSINEGLANLKVTTDLTSPINNALKVVVVSVKNTVASALLIAKDALSELYVTTKNVLPPELKSSLNISEEYADKFFTPFNKVTLEAYSSLIDFEKSLGIDPDNPAIPVVLIIGLGAAYLQFKYSGYSGNLQPSGALDLVRKEGNALLVDVRPQDLKQRQGIPDVRRGTRSKFAAVEPMKVERSIRSQLKNAGEIDNILTAAIIRSLKRVDSSTKVIVLDSDGNESKRIARALKKAGVRNTFIVEGGFEAWKKSGLRSKPTVPETPFMIIKEETEAIIEDVKPTPEGIVLVVIGFVAGVKALIEWEKTLQLVGVIGIAYTTYDRFSSYKSLDDLKADLRNLQTPFQLAAQGVLWIAGKVEPVKLQLATSPSTSAVQDRVLQAAAKHGSVASEVEQDQTVEEALEESSGRQDAQKEI